jgi:hypothetical protein
MKAECMTLRRQLNSNAVITKSATKGLLRDGGLVAMAIVTALAESSMLVGRILITSL